MKRIFFALTFMASPVAAQNLAETLMQPGLLVQIPKENLPCYAHRRQAQPADEGMNAPDNVQDEKVCLVRSADQGREHLELSLTDAGQARVVAQFPLETSNPILLFFLENVVRVVATHTGGSPYYVRNRLREALIAGQQVPDGGAAQVIMHPFDNDPNRDRLGDFADIAVTLRYDPADPARLLQLSADTADGDSGYTETMTLLPEE